LPEIDSLMESHATNRNLRMNLSKRIYKHFFVVSTIFAPFYFIFPTSFSLYDLFLSVLFFLFILSDDKLTFPDKKILAMFILLFLGYVLSIYHAVNPMEAIKWPLQLFFILMIQSSLAWSLIETIEDIKQHVAALCFSSVGVIFAYFHAVYTGGPEVGQRGVATAFGINAVAVLSMMLFFVCTVYLAYMIRKKNSSPRLYFDTFFISAIAIGLLYISISTQSRRVIIAFIICFAILISTRMFEITNVSQISARLVVGGGGFFMLSLLMYQQGLIPEEFIRRFVQTIQGERDIDRWVTFSHGIKVFAETFPLGTGYNNAVVTGSELVEFRVRNSPHNIILNPLVEGGILSAIGMIGLITVFAKRFILRIVNTNNNKIQMAIPIGTVCFFITHLFGTMPAHRIFWLFIIFGLLCVSTNLETKVDTFQA